MGGEKFTSNDKPMPTDEQIWKMLDAWYQLIGRRVGPSKADRERDFATMKRSVLAFEEEYVAPSPS